MNTGTKFSYVVLCKQTFYSVIFLGLLPELQRKAREPTACYTKGLPVSQWHVNEVVIGTSVYFNSNKMQKR